MNQAEWAISKVVRRPFFLGQPGILLTNTMRKSPLTTGLIFATIPVGVALWVVAASGWPSGAVVDAPAGLSGPGATRVAGVVGWLGRLHPLAVHFPIALIFVSGLAELLYVLTGKEAFAFTTRYLLYVASGVAVVSVLLGFAAATGKTYPEEVRWAFGFHRVMGVVTAGTLVLTAGLARAAHMMGGAWRHKLYRVMLAVTLALVGFTGHTGATLVFGAGYLTYF
ncbi:MAG: hypothetical protein OEN01_08600 [Candidatus Krumholzibacteria bacterium]|nr:hypothetical protein [Candidatus Krumholzibacteria bacterium]